jgi:radical SAM superfamily enzyme YgiQ (UPF0313 family)
MQLISILKHQGHKVEWILLQHHDILQSLSSLNPDVIAYSAMSVDIPLIKKADDKVKQYSYINNKRILRIMGGASPTYYPGVINDLELDAICQGEGDRAIVAVLQRYHDNQSLEGVPNIALNAEGAKTKEMVDDLDSLPFPDREFAYPDNSYLRHLGLRSVLTARGCPFMCTYCMNSVLNTMFKGSGKIIRRRSVDNVIKELKEVVKNTQPVRMIRFADDTFSFTPNKWLEEFAEKYKRMINLPFYCMMRPNTLDKKSAELLSKAGCKSISMNIESGASEIRKGVLKRNISDDILIRSFKIAKEYNLNVQSNSMIAVPGSKISDDLNTLEVVRNIKPEMPTFDILVPFKGTKIWELSVEMGVLDPSINTATGMFDSEGSILNNYTEKEKRIQLRIVNLGFLYCLAPRWFAPFIKMLILKDINIPFLSKIAYMIFFTIYNIRIFPPIIPRSPRYVWKMLKDTLSLVENAKVREGTE